MCHVRGGYLFIVKMELDNFVRGMTLHISEGSGVACLRLLRYIGHLCLSSMCTLQVGKI